MALVSLSSAALDRWLAVLVVAMAVTGLLTLRAGSPETGWLFVAHGLLAGALAAAVVLKVRSSVRRAVGAGRRSRLVLGLVVTLAAAAALSGGYLWVASGRLLTVGSWTVLTLHAWVGLALVPLVVVHLLPRRWRLLRPSAGAARRTASRAMSRRSFLATAGLAAAGIGLFGLASVVEHVRGGTRRFTGSRWLEPGTIPPGTTFFGEGAPPIDPASWLLTVRGPGREPVSLTLTELRAIGESERLAVLDCTSGWVVETPWRGVTVASVLAAAGIADAQPANVTVRSATGWATVLAGTEALDCLLATGVAGVDLPVANGAPVRLVVPNRRGLDWVKWVTEIEVA